MRVLVACEFSGVVRDAFTKRGHYAVSCDLLPSNTEGPHYQGDIFEFLSMYPVWDLMIAHPDCTYLCSSGLHWNTRPEGIAIDRAGLTLKALDFVRRLLDQDIEKIALENPQGRIGTQIRKADQYIQPHEYGHDASKRTGLWLKNLPLLVPTKHIAPRMVKGKPRWANQTDSGQNKLGPSDDRWAKRAETYQGIADAFAEQWG